MAYFLLGLDHGSKRLFWTSFTNFSNSELKHGLGMRHLLQHSLTMHKRSQTDMQLVSLEANKGQAYQVYCK